MNHRDEPRKQMRSDVRVKNTSSSHVASSKSRDGIVIGSSRKIGGTGGRLSAKGKIIAEEGWISLGPWGGEGGGYKTYKLDGPILQITIRYGYVICSILFESKSRNGALIGSSGEIGCAKGNARAMDKIKGGEGCISLGPWGGTDGEDWAYKTNGPIMQISICYGQAIDSVLFESKSCDGVLIGSPKKIGGSGGHATETGKISGEEGWISLGPWGGKGGKDWAYKPDGPIIQITIWSRDFIDQILFESKSSDGIVIGDSVKIGKPGFGGCQLKTV
ncbi:hypothetical protein RHSIM_Rhsim12G0045700 [Rhododendron simsii]|uniref:Jacalin-type lectin domain-containing protein n=1 Tax=Rhododendron simsii TaxID=118357 RepID=A0A834G3D5_RHOSS|nr:hypothetical protein RHSIM_Rhsim12G0045700 [Rhododendron simsii]